MPSPSTGMLGTPCISFPPVKLLNQLVPLPHPKHWHPLAQWRAEGGAGGGRTVLGDTLKGGDTPRATIEKKEHLSSSIGCEDTHLYRFSLFTMFVNKFLE